MVLPSRAAVFPRAAGLGLLLLLVLAGCARGPEITISWTSAKPGLEKGVPLRYETIDIGHVVQVASGPEGTTVRARLEKKYTHYVRTRSTFLFHPESGGRNAFVEVIVLDKNAPPAPPDAHFSGSDSAMQVAVKMITTDWKRTAIYCAVGLGLLLLLLLAVKTFLKLWAVLASLAAGIAAAAYLSPMLDTQLRTFMPPEIRTDLVAYILAFLFGSLVISVCLGIIFKPMRHRA